MYFDVGQIIQDPLDNSVVLIEAKHSPHTYRVKILIEGSYVSNIEPNLWKQEYVDKRCQLVDNKVIKLLYA